MKVLLIRHTSVNMPPGTCYGQTDVPLADTFGQEAVDVRRRPPGMVRRFPPSARNRLYHLWFYDYARNHEMTLFSDSVTFKNTKYYAGILLRHDHPLHDMILAYYQDFSKHVPELFTPRDK